jgi:hypothetical protein
VRSDRENDEHSAPAAIIARPPPSAVNTLAILPQNWTAGILLAVAGKSGKKYVSGSGRAAIVHGG